MDGLQPPPKEDDAEPVQTVIFIPFDFVGFEERMARIREHMRQQEAMKAYGASLFGFGVHL